MKSTSQRPSRWPLKIGVAAAGLALAIAPPRGQGQKTPEQSFAESTEVTVVEVPVQVVRDGEPLRGLTANDFEVYDGRKRVTLTGFEVLDLASPGNAAAAASAPVPSALRRHFLLLFDLSFSEPKSIVKARQAARGLVLKSLHPSDLVAVATYSLANGPQLVLGFTPDRRQVEAALNTLGLPQLIDRNVDPLRLVAAEAKSAAGSAGGSDKLDTGIKADVAQELAELLRGYSKVSDRANRQVMEGAVKGLTRSFADLARLMSSVQGRKQVVYLSEGFDSALLQGTTSVEEQAKMADQASHGQFDQIESDARFGNTKLTSQMDRMLEEFRRADCIIQAVDIGGLRAGAEQGAARPAGADVLLEMAHDTGGELFERFNDLGEAMGKMLQRTSVTYVLSFHPEELKRDGSYHKLRVELKNAPRGAKAIARPGYYAPKPYGKTPALEKLLFAADEVVGGGAAGSIHMGVLAAPFRVSGDRAYVPVVVEVNGSALMNGVQGTTLPTEIYVYAMDSGGAIRDFFTQNLGLDLGKVAPALRQSGLKFFGHVDLPAGQYSLRVLVRNSATGSYGVRSVSVAVPAFGQPLPVLLPPLFPEAPGKWLMVREAPRGEQKSSPPYPFMARDKPYIPASMPSLASGVAAAVSLVGYHLPAGALKAEARVMAMDGRDLGTGELKVGEREEGGSNGPDRLTATFRPPQGLAPGQYKLVVTLTDGQGAVQKSDILFEVAAAGQGAKG
ncbi:MAG TPA: VWA domain-containing protein [Thermoanaerobaculia bacterium]|nr:VWA domain-containing protein [Thermoanaerobaculia bacterium]